MSGSTAPPRGGGPSRGRGKANGRVKGGAPASAYSKARIADGSAINRPGVFVSCTKGKETACLGELFTLFNSLADELYPDMDVSAPLPTSDPGPSHFPPIDIETDGISENTSDITMEEIVITSTVAGKGKEKMSFEEELARELSDLKEGKDIQRFYNVPMETACTAFIAFRPPLVPSKLVHHYMHQVKDTGISRLRHVSRLVPVDAVGPANVTRMMEMSKPLLSAVFDDPSRANLTWRIIYNARSQPKLTRQQVTDELPKLVPGHKVDLKRGDIVVIIEVFKSIMGVSVLEDYDVLKKYNVQELVNQYNQAKGGATDAGRVAKVANVKLVPAATSAAAEDEQQMTDAGTIGARLEVLAVEKILHGAIGKEEVKTKLPSNPTTTNVQNSNTPSTHTSSHVTPIPEQQPTTLSIRHLLPPKPSAQVVAAGNQPVGQMPKEKMEKKATEVMFEKKDTEDKVDETDEKGGKQTVQGAQGKQQSSQAVQPQQAQHGQHPQQNERHQRGQQAQHSQSQHIQYQAQPPPQAQSQHQPVPIAPWLLPLQHPGYPQQALNFAPSQPLPIGAYMNVMQPGYRYGQDQAGPSNLSMAYPPGFPQHPMFQPGVGIPSPPPPVPYASRPGMTSTQAVSPAVSRPVIEEEMGKAKVKPAWKRGEPVKRDRRGRCWHCGADRAHAAEDVVERDGMGGEVGKKRAREDGREMKDVKRPRR